MISACSQYFSNPQVKRWLQPGGRLVRSLLRKVSALATRSELTCAGHLQLPVHPQRLRCTIADGLGGDHAENVFEHWTIATGVRTTTSALRHQFPTCERIFAYICNVLKVNNEFVLLPVCYPLLEKSLKDASYLSRMIGDDIKRFKCPADMKFGKTHFCTIRTRNAGNTTQFQCIVASPRSPACFARLETGDAVLHLGDITR